ncbi:rhodanese-like domain-containing protein [Paenibacillus tyrfis]|uniref:rhodanese-like domain-containing protein n=1 Tax=Paenibacillus TaxID=44249 RepID=UPI00249354DC|nr:rhodanese-like domain-containing protein [Paenibacillus tyrfis]GLI10642.1 rhodanese-like domain-containing protein [Paenibacillus tyrfis]GMX62322.1 rhodanese-like domain-containing protein [Paenibacillus elgii]
MHTITPQEVKQRLENGEKLTIIDVREPDEVALGMIPGAKHIPLMEIPQRLGEIPQQSETILVCRSGNRSGRALEYLEAQGFTGLVNMTGGMLEWEQL